MRSLNIFAICRCLLICILLLSPDILFSQGVKVNMPPNSTDQNFVTKAVLKEALSDSKTEINTGNSVITTVYYDGFGHKQQTVLHGASNSNEDIADFTEYDARGRVTRQWLPVIGTTLDGSFNPLSYIKNQSREFYGDSRAYSSVSYCGTVESRVNETKKSGTTWQNNTGIVAGYNLNTSANELCCVRFEVDPATGKLRKNGIYPNSELSVNISTDEDGEQIYRFTNKNDSTILTRTIEQDFIDTYYVYDIYGNLSYVLPPMASADLSERSNGIIENTDQVLQKYAYIYDYDYRNRCISQKLPGAETVYMVYNEYDLLVFTQDGNQRAKSEWTYYVYDKFKRLVYSGLVENSQTHDAMCESWKTRRLEASYTGANFFGYSLAVVPSPSKEKVLLVNYYDNYNFLSLFDQEIISNLNYIPESTYGTKYDSSTPGISTKGMLTGSLTRLLDETNQILLKAVYYDDKGRIVQSRENNHLGGYEKKFYQYSFTGNPLKYKHVNSTAPKNISSTEEYTYTYDKLDRPLTTSHSWYGADKVVLAKNSYNDLGQLSGVYINNKVSIGYGYDMHGWLTSVTSPKKFTQTLRYATRSDGTHGCLDGNICEMNWSADGPTLKNPNNPLGISRRYSYYYDNIDRLVEAKYSETKVRESPVNVTFENTPNYSTTYSYDLNGNITSLTRKGIYEKYHLSASEYWSYATVDSLAYTLDGNRVTSINDDALCYNPAYNGAFDFPDNTYSDDEYTYDANGNMTSDSNKDITGIEYNYLNLPACITFADGHVTEYIYDALGTKRRAIYKVQPEALFAPVENSLESITTAGQLVVVSSKDYCDNHIYNKEGYLNTILIDNGYIDGGRYHFYIKDYQGNNRVVFDQAGNVEQVNHYYPYGGTFGEGTGFNDVQSYKYGGKELDRMNGLNTYDFGARHLDSSKGGWDSLDPMAGKYYSISPYAYCKGNPILYTDPDGTDVYIYDSRSGKMILALKTDDKFDQIANASYDKKTDSYTLKTNKNGTSKIHIDQIEKGILKDGINFRDNNNVIEVGGEDQASVKGFESFITEFADFVGKEISGYYLTNNGEDNISYIGVAPFVNNRIDQARSTFQLGRTRLDLLNKVSHHTNFHTHPSYARESDRLRASPLDYKAKESDIQHNVKRFIILTRWHDPKEY